MAYQIYPFTGTNATFFSQDLIQYVLEDFGHIWKPERSQIEQTLRKNARFSFTTEIGKTVAFLSRKHDRFVVGTCYKSWKYIMSHRASVLKFLLFNDISYLCSKCQLEDDDFGLFIFMAIVVEYARFAIVDRQQHLVEEVVKALSHCMKDLIPGGYITTIERMQYRASTFNLSELSTNVDDSERSFTVSISTDTVLTPESKCQTPLNYNIDFSFGSIQYNCPMEGEIEVQCQQRELQRRLFQFTLETRRFFETNDNNASVTGSRKNVASKSDILTEEDGQKNERNKESWTEKIVDFKSKETNEETQSTGEGSSTSNNEKGETKFGPHINLTNDKIQTESSEVSQKEVSPNDLHCPTKIVDDISETLQKISFSEDKQSGGEVMVDSEKGKGEQNVDRTVDDSSAGEANPITP